MVLSVRNAEIFYPKMKIGDENSKPVSTSKWLEYLDKPTDNQHSLGIVAPDELQNLPTAKMASNILKRIV